jgi:uncharacterized protein (TIGR03435 family)
MRIVSAAAAVLILGVAQPHLGAQGPEPVLSPTLSFDVSSVKVDNSETRAPMLWRPGGHFTMRLPIQSLVSIGYQVPLYRIVGLPDWVRTVFFDINARADRQVTIEERPAYYRGLLEERFMLKAHLERREMPVYQLVLARSDGRLGPGLRRSDANCEAAIAENRRRADAGERPAPPAPGVRPVCAAIGGPANLTAGAVDIAILTGLFSSGLERPVIDKTGLSGRFDIDFRSAPMRVADAARAPADLPSVFTAVQEQLGLELQPATAPVTVLVVDHLGMPSAD